MVHTEGAIASYIMTDIERTVNGLELIIEMMSGVSVIFGALYYVFESTGIWFLLVGSIFAVGMVFNILGVYINYLATNTFLK